MKKKVISLVLGIFLVCGAVSFAVGENCPVDGCLAKMQKPSETLQVECDGRTHSSLKGAFCENGHPICNSCLNDPHEDIHSPINFGKSVSKEIKVRVPNSPYELNGHGFYLGDAYCCVARYQDQNITVTPSAMDQEPTGGVKLPVRRRQGKNPTCDVM